MRMVDSVAISSKGTTRTIHTAGTDLLSRKSECIHIMSTTHGHLNFLIFFCTFFMYVTSGPWTLCLMETVYSTVFRHWATHTKHYKWCPHVQLFLNAPLTFSRIYKTTVMITSITECRMEVRQMLHLSHTTIQSLYHSLVMLQVIWIKLIWEIWDLYVPISYQSRQVHPL